MLWIIHVIIWLSVSVNETRFEKIDSKIIVTSYLVLLPCFTFKILILTRKRRVFFENSEFSEQNPLAGTSGRTFNVGLMEKELLEILAQSLNFE